MVFSSVVFLFLFLPLVLIGYYNPFFKSRSFRNVFLLLASLFFYAWGEPVFVFLMLLSIVVNWRLGLLIEKRGKTRPYVALCVAFNVGALLLFKYLAAVAGRLSAAGYNLGGAGILARLSLPIGISFYTFQALSYVLDVAHKKCGARAGLLDVGLYIACFPQLIAGPIVRYETVAAEIDDRPDGWAAFRDGVPVFIIGLAKKALLANLLGRLADTVFAYKTPAVPVAWLGAVVYTLQIYFDFSGYSDMAIGLGRMFGFRYPENFNYPYMATSISNFWRRWHISLSQWFRDYVYIPLGGNRVSQWKQVRNLFVVWLLTGLWHGANWTFVLWGLSYFVLLSAEKKWGLDKKDRWWSRAYTLLFVGLLWVVFRSDSLSFAARYIGAMFGVGAAAATSDAYVTVLRALPIVAIGSLCATDVFKTLASRIKNEKFKHAAAFVALTALLILSVASVVSSGYAPFIYFKF